MSVVRNNKGYPLRENGTIDEELANIEKAEYESLFSGNSKYYKIDENLSTPKRRRYNRR